MNYTSKFGYQLVQTDGTELVVKEYQYDDVPYTIEKVYKNLIERLRGVKDHFLFPANDKQVIDINSRVMIKLKEFTPNTNASSGYLQITLKNVDPNTVSTVMRIPRNEFELYTLVSIIQYILDATTLDQNINIIKNANTVYYENHDYSKFSVFIEGVSFDITQSGKKFVCRPRITNCDLVETFDDIADYQTVASTMHKTIINDSIVCTEILHHFRNIVFNIELNKSTSIYTYQDLLKITYVGPHNVHIKLLNSIETSTVIGSCKHVVNEMINYGINKLSILKHNV